MSLLIDRIKLIIDEHPELEGDQGQAGLVKASGASKSVVNQWLSGKIKTMNIEFALEIEKNLGYCHIWLMTGREPVRVGDKGDGNTINVKPETLSPSQQDYTSLGDISEFIDTYRKADSDSREMLMKSVRAIRKGDTVGSDLAVGSSRVRYNS